MILSFVLLVVLFIGGFGIYRYINLNTTDKNRDQESLIFKHFAGGSEGDSEKGWEQYTYLYNSGKLLFVGDVNKEVQLDDETMDTIINTIRKSGILERDCSEGPLIVDFIEEYEINLDGKTKNINVEDTGCIESLKEINNIIDSYLHQ